MKIALYCQFGVSTHLLLDKIKEAGRPEDVVEAFPVGELAGTIDRYDIVLLAPQVRSHRSHVHEIADPKGIPVALVDMMQFGRLDGKGIYAMAKKTLEDYRKNQT